MGKGSVQKLEIEAAIMDVMKCAAILLMTALSLSATRLVSSQSANRVPVPGPGPNKAARVLLAAPLKTTAITLEGPRHSSHKIRVQLPKGLEVSRNAYGKVGREAWIRPGMNGPELGLEMELGLWSDDGMTMSTGTTVTKRDGPFTVSTTTYPSGDVDLRVTRPAGKAFDGILSCTARVSGWGVDPELRVKTRARALKICKSFELVAR